MRKSILLVTVFALSFSLQSGHASEPEIKDANSQSALDKAKTLYEEAQELYKAGPDGADKTIAKLKEALKADPKHREATALLAITYFGIEQFEKSLEMFKRAFELYEKTGSLKPEFQYRIAVCLAQLNRLEESRTTLLTFSAMFAADDELRKKTDELMEKVVNAQREAGRQIAINALSHAIEKGFDPTKFGITLVSKHTHPFILNDSDLKPLIPPLALDEKFITVVMFPTSKNTDAALCIMFDRESQDVVGTFAYGSAPIDTEKQLGYALNEVFIKTSEGGIPVLTWIPVEVDPENLPEVDEG